MYKQIFEVNVPYRMPDDPTLNGPFGQIVYPPLLAYFTTPPRIYGEEFVLVNAMLVKKEPTPNGPITITLNVISSNIYYPDVGMTMKYDGVTGAFMGYGELIGDALDTEIVQSMDGSIWSTYDGALRELDPVTYAVMRTIAADFFEIPADQEFHGIAHPMIDRTRGLIVMSGYPTTVDARYILVNDLATGALIRRIWVSGAVAQIMQEDDRRCFVMCTNGIMNVVDYTTGKIISTTRTPVAGPHSAFVVTYAWDFVLRRLLAFNFVDGEFGAPPINADGSSSNTITGYYPVPIATNITKPVPLKPPRKGRTVPMLVRAVGDAGEAIPSLPLSVTATAPGAIGPGAQVTDANGYATINLIGTDAGSSEVSATANVDDGYPVMLSGGGTGGGAGTAPVAPILSAPAATQTGSTTASGTVSTDQGNGMLYTLFSTGSTATAADVKAGQVQGVTAAGAQNVNVAGLTASTTYYPHYLHRNNFSLESAVVTGASFTTAAASGGGGGGGGGSTATVTYTASTSVITNPERGFYVHILHGGDFSGGNLYPYKAQNMSLVLYQAYLTSYRTSALDSTFLTAFQNNLNSIRSNGMKTILRFAYTSTDTNDATLIRIQGHLDQLAPYLSANSDVIIGMQCGWVGQWGEFQGSTNFGADSWPPNLSTANKAARKAVIDKALSVMPSNRFVQVRQPWIKMDAYGSTPLNDTTKFNGSSQARVGHFNDCFLSGSTDSGTYWNQSSEESFLELDTRYVPMGGETCTFNEPRSSGATALTEMTRFHWTFINSGYNESVINSWKASGHYDIFNKRLGYRLSLTSGTYSTTASRGGAMSVSFSLNNDGFAAPVSQRTVKVVLRNTSTNAVTVLPMAVDLRNWLPGSTITVTESLTVPSTVAAGTYALLLWLPDPAAGLASIPDYAIQLANTSMWESDTGYNDLGHTITIS